jgi:hypothetical protein
MNVVQRCLAILFVSSVIGAVYLSFRDIALPDASVIDDSVKMTEPLQGATDRQVFTTVIKGYTYTLTPRASYDISGLVVSQHSGDALLNIYHKADPGNIEDVCVVWGEAITNGSYQKVRYKSEEFSCYYSWAESFTPPFNPEKIANNHLIPADASIAEQIRAIRIGDQIRMRGLLVDYAVARGGQGVFTRKTSLTRKDTGNGACEILYVTDLRVIQAGNHLEADAKRYAWRMSLGLFAALGVVWFVRLAVE